MSSRHVKNQVKCFSHTARRKQLTSEHFKAHTTDKDGISQCELACLAYHLSHSAELCHLYQCCQSCQARQSHDVQVHVFESSITLLVAAVYFAHGE